MAAPTNRRSVLIAALSIFWGCLLVYHVNGRPHAGGDTIAAPYTAWSLLRHGSLDLHRYSDLKPFVGVSVYEVPDGQWISIRPPGVAGGRPVRRTPGPVPRTASGANGDAPPRQARGGGPS